MPQRTGDDPAGAGSDAPLTPPDAAAQMENANRRVCSMHSDQSTPSAPSAKPGPERAHIGGNRLPHQSCLRHPDRSIHCPENRRGLARRPCAALAGYGGIQMVPSCGTYMRLTAMGSGKIWCGSCHKLPHSRQMSHLLLLYVRLISCCSMRSTASTVSPEYSAISSLLNLPLRSILTTA